MNRWGFLLVCCLAVCCIAPSSARAQTASSVQPIYGTWYIYPLGNPDTDSIREEFRHDSATGKDLIAISRLCRGDYRTVIATAISPVEISGSTVRVMKSTTATQKGELNSECHASVEAGLWSYTLSPDGSRLTITNPGGKPDVVELARQDTSSASDLPASLYGTWLMPAQAQHDERIETRLVFYSTADASRGKVRQIATCRKGETRLVSQADSDIEVSKDSIRILNSASNVQHDGPFTCEVNITAGTLNYVVSDGGATMTLSKGGGPSLKLTRDHHRGLN